MDTILLTYTTLPLQSVKRTCGETNMNIDGYAEATLIERQINALIPLGGIEAVTDISQLREIARLVRTVRINCASMENTVMSRLSSLEKQRRHSYERAGGTTG